MPLEWGAVACGHCGVPPNFAVFPVPSSLEITESCRARASPTCCRGSLRFQECGSSLLSFSYIKSGSTGQNRIPCEVCLSCTPSIWQCLPQTLHSFLLRCVGTFGFSVPIIPPVTPSRLPIFFSNTFILSF